MNAKLLVLIMLLLSMQSSVAQQPPTSSIRTIADPTPEQREVIELSKLKWHWMADKNADSLDALFDERSMFIHMGGTWGKEQELATIRTGGIWYKKAEVHEVLVNVFGNTAILLNDIDLVAEVGGKEVANPFMVTEVYVKSSGRWKMGSLTFSLLRRPLKIKFNADK